MRKIVKMICRLNIVNMKVNEGHIRKFVRAREKSKKVKKSLYREFTEMTCIDLHRPAK